MSRSTLGACCAVFGLSCLPGSAARAQTPPRYRVRAFQRVTTRRQETLIHFQTGKPDKPVVEQTGESSQMAATLLVSLDKTLPNGATRWNATIETVAFASSNPRPTLPPDWPARMRQREADKWRIALDGVRRVVDALRGAPCAFVREGDGRISSFDLSGIAPRCYKVLSHAGREDTGFLAFVIAPLQTAELWRSLLDGQMPRAPQVFRVGTTAPYVVPLFLIPVRDFMSEGVSTVRLVSGEGQTARTEVVSRAEDDLPFDDHSGRVPDAAEMGIVGKFTLTARTMWSAGNVWPIEHNATEQVEGATTITGVDKAKRAHLIDKTPFTFKVESRLVATPY